MSIAIIDYKAGNLTSVKLAFDALGAQTVVTADPQTILAADRVVFPGVGAAGAAMANLESRGLIPILRQVIARGTPFLGICVGTQVLFDRSEEDGGTDTLGLLPGTVDRFRFDDPRVKVPQMGWNQVEIVRSHPLLAGVDDQSDFYFVHSYYPHPSDPADIVGRTDYAGRVFASMVGRGNIVATQFHVEKSGRVGLHVLGNFIRWNGTV